MPKSTKKLLVTGATGYLGKYIVKYYLEREFEIIIILRSKIIVQIFLNRM